MAYGSVEYKLSWIRRHFCTNYKVYPSTKNLGWIKVKKCGINKDTWYNQITEYQFKEVDFNDLVKTRDIMNRYLWKLRKRSLLSLFAAICEFIDREW